MNSKKKLAKIPTPRPLPIMQTFDDAEALALKEKDLFYIAAFLIQCWLGGLVQRAATEYAEKKNPKDRSLQNGEAWRAFSETFDSVTRKGHRYLLSCLLRFSACADSPRNSLRRALVALSIEHRCNPALFGLPSTPDGRAPASPHPGRESSGPHGTQPSRSTRGFSSPTLNAQCSTPNDRARLTITRWCDWLDAAIHLRTHRHWHAAPACFDPDPETRALAGLGNAERHLAQLDARGQISWILDFAQAAAQYQHSPKWAVVGKAMSDDPDRLWLYADVDTLVIALWPLVKQYNWTYRDLLNLIRPALKRPNAYPCDREQAFATYCINVLGLHKTGRGLTATDGRPKGYEIAFQWCPVLEQKATNLKR